MEETRTHEMSSMYPGSVHTLPHRIIIGLCIFEQSKNYCIKDEKNSSPGELLVL